MITAGASGDRVGAGARREIDVQLYEGSTGRTPGKAATMKGDKVEIVIDAGGATRTYEVTATRAGRRVEITQGRGIIEVSEVTRGGTTVRTARFMSARVLALVEHPAPRPAQPDDEEVAQLHRSA
jgi:hypothetical protein